MEKIQAKPLFKEGVTITPIELDNGLVFNAQRVGPMNFNGLRNADYGSGFKMSPMSKLVQLVYASLKNKDFETAKNVIKTLRSNWITGNTAIHYFPEGMFVEDIPAMNNGRIITPTYKELEQRLGSYQEREVAFSDDKSIRFTLYNYKIESQSALELSKNAGVIALTGSEENAEKIAKVCEHYKLKPYFFALSKVDSPQTRVAGLLSGYFGGRLGVDAVISEGVGGRFSFGVFDGAEGTTPKK